MQTRFVGVCKLIWFIKAILLSQAREHIFIVRVIFIVGVTGVCDFLSLVCLAVPIASTAGDIIAHNSQSREHIFVLGGINVDDCFISIDCFFCKSIRIIIKVPLLDGYGREGGKLGKLIRLRLTGTHHAGVLKHKK